jgi:hypothetical protein
MKKIDPVDWLFYMIMGKAGVSEEHMDNVCLLATDEELEALFDDDMDKIKAITDKYKPEEK